MTDLVIDQGDDEVIDVTVLNATNQPVNLTGCKLWFYVKTSPNKPDTDALISKTTEVSEGISVTNAAGGLAEITIDKADTASLAVGLTGRQLAWSLQMKDQTQKVTTLAKGGFLVNRDLIATTT